MTGRELVKRAIHFENPLRIPYNYNSEKCDLICCMPEEKNFDVLRKTAEENHGEKYLVGVFRETDDYAADIRMMAECGMDGIIVADMSLTQQNDVKLYKEMAAVAHECGLDVILHTNSVDIAEKYVEHGADAIWMDEPDMTGLEKLREHLRGKVCFFCTPDVKTVLNSDREELFEYCDKLVRFLSTENGGFIAACLEKYSVTEEGMQNLEECFAAESLCRYKAKISMDTELHLASEKLVMLPGESRQMKQLNSVYKTNDWYTDDTEGKVIRIQDGMVTAEGLGEAAVVITSDWGVSQTYVFRVEVKEKRDLQETGLALNRGEVRLNLHSMYDMPLYVQFGCYTEPSSSGNVTWTSSEPSVAAVGEDGRVHPVSAGETVISAVHKDFPDSPVTCKVTVYENAPCSHFYYISPNGSDENTGTEAAPFKTIQKARDVIRGLKELPDGGVTVILEDGKYLQEEPIVFTPEDSGTESAPVIYRARNCGKAVITGEKVITGWRKAENVPGLSEAAAGNVYVADITPGWRFHDMYLNGVRQQNSRSVNTDTWREWPAFYGRVELERCNEQQGMCVRFEEGELDGLDGNEDVEIVVLPMQFWNMIAVLGEIDSKSNTAYLRSRVPAFMKKYFINKDVSGGTGEGWYNILNTLKYLDEPGEWCVDSKAGKVYYWPINEESIHQDEIVAPVPYELVRLQGDGVDHGFKNVVEYLSFDGISFQYTDRMPEDQMPEDWLIRNAENPDAAVFFDGTRHCGLHNCEVCHSGAYAVTVNNFAQNNEILHNNLTDLGSGGVQLLGYGVGTVDVNHHNIVQYNSVSGMGRAPYQHSPGFTVFGSGYNAIAYNSIKGAPYAGVSIVGTAYDAVCRKEEDRNKYTCVDAFGNKAHQYRIRFEELEMLPEEELDGGSEYFFSPATCAKKYQHSVNNVVEYNILDDYSQSMDDGGGLYAWSPGVGNTYAYNVLKEQLQGTRTWVFRLYLDDIVMGVTMEKNLCTGYFDATLDKSYLFAPYLNRWGIHGTDTNLRTVYPEKPDGYDEQRNRILETVKKFTGTVWGEKIV